MIPVVIFAAATHAARLEHVNPRMAEQGWGTLGVDKSVSGGKLQIGDRPFEHGIGTHARSDLVYLIGGAYRRFTAWVGMDAFTKDYPRGSVQFLVFTDGKKRFDSGVMRPNDSARQVDLDILGVQTLRLVVTDAGDGIYADHADWCDPTLIGDGPTPPAHVTAKEVYAVRTKGLRVALSKDGQVVGLNLGRRGVRASGFSTLFGEARNGKTKVARRKSGELLFIRDTVCGGRACVVTESFRPTESSIRWTVKIHTSSKNWSTPVDTHLFWPAGSGTRFWTAWGHGAAWEDPLIPKPFREMTLDYGGFFSRDDGFSLPLMTILDGDRALSLIESPEDTLIEMKLATAARGKRWDLSFSRAFLRLGDHDVQFVMDLVPHPADPRCALGWIAKRYPKFFDPPNPRTYEVGGGGAYSGYEGPLDAAKLHAMGFSMNWKASLDFPFMGLFLPPVTSDDQEWNRFAGGGGGSYGSADEGRYGKTSLRQMAAYSKQMRASGFHVLNYFNVTEFGGNIELPPKRDRAHPSGWDDPTGFLIDRFPGAILRTPGPMWTWGGAVVMDCGDPGYRSFLLEQAKRHIEKLPASDGICIDRMDWLSRFNPNADDGVTWIDGKRRSLYRSWISLLSILGPAMHRAGKVIYVNCMIQRPDLMRHVDGVYDEFGNIGYKLNLCSFLCLRKPQVCWTPEPATLQPDPDAYFQRHLYMGAFPTVPLPGNDHTILPSPEVDKLYADYGPLFNALRGRKWVLTAHPVQVVSGRAKANLFRVPGGHLLVVAFAKTPEVTVRVNALRHAGRMVALRPGGSHLDTTGLLTESLTPDTTGLLTESLGALRLRPVRGCIVVKIADKPG